jgi:O-antigen/teichoic acid export membrane protein
MLLRTTLRYLPAQLIGPLFQVVSVVVWTHVTNEPALGVITLVTATHELLQTLFLFWWSQSALRFFGSFKTEEDVARYYGTENAVLMISVVVQSVIAVIILRSHIVPGAGAALSAAVVGYVTTRSYNLYIAERARVRHEVTVYTIQQTAGPALGFVVGLVLPLIKFGWRVGPIDRVILRQALQYGVPLVLGGGLAWIGANASRFVVSDMLGIGAAGLFAVGYGLGWRAAAVAAMMVTASAFPIAVRKMEEGGARPALRQLSDNGALLAGMLLPSVIGVFILRDEIVRLLIAPTFQDATLAILPLAALAGAQRNCRSHFSDQVFLLYRRTRLLVVINGVEAALTVGLSLLFVWRWGLLGSVMANVAATAIAAVASFAAAIVVFRLPLPLLHLAKIVVAAGMMAAVLFELPERATPLALVLHIALGAAIYATVLAMLYAQALAAMWGRHVKPRLSPARRSV